MKKFLLLGVALSALVAGPAVAADLRRPPPPVYKAPAPVAPIWSWTGCYVGGHFGGLWASKDWTGVVPGIASVNLGSHDVDSWLGGIQGGCDYQFAGGWVIGIAGDYAWSDATGSHSWALDPTISFHTKINSLASVTGRIGYAWDRFLGYVKGGGAWERDELTITDSFFGFSETRSKTRSGWTVGVGGEYAFTNYLSGFIEYNYYDFGAKGHDFPLTGFNVDVDETKSVVKAGLNLRFGGWAAPVTARW